MEFQTVLENRNEDSVNFRISKVCGWKKEIGNLEVEI